MSRWILFVVMVGLGAAAGLYYGWVISPVEYVDTAPSTLREDYKADYVLMVAEAYRAGGDLNQAVRQLAVLGSQSPAEIVRSAINFAVTVQPPYPENDLALMRKLADDLKSYAPAQETPTR